MENSPNQHSTNSSYICYINMKINIYKSVAALFVLFTITSCGQLNSEVEKQLNELKSKTETLDSLVNSEVDKVLTLDTLINTEKAKLQEIDSLLNKNKSKLDAILQ